MRGWASQLRAHGGASVVVVVMVMVMFMSMPSMIVVVPPAPLIVIVPVSPPEPMEMFAGKVDISRPVPALIQHWVRVVEVIPRARANEHPTRYPLRSPVAIRTAPESIVRVVAVGACRRNVIVAVVPADMDTDRNLGRRSRCRQHDKYTE